MNKTELKEALCAHTSLFSVNHLTWKIEQESDRFPVLYELASTDGSRSAYRALWVCEKLSEKHPSWFAPFYNELIEKLERCKHEGSRRLLLSILHNLPVPPTLPVQLLNYCFDHMLLPQESIAIQALSIKTAYKLCRQDPDLLNELKTVLENVEAEYYSPGVQAAIRGTLQKLKKVAMKRD